MTVARIRVNGVFGLKERPAAVLVSVLIAFKIAILFLFAWHHRIVMDEFAQLGWAKYLEHGLYSSVWPSKSMGFTVFCDLAHRIGWDARSILLIGRMQSALLACGTLALVYAIARTLGQSRARAALILLILLSFSNFIERIIETRAEPLATFFAAAALLAALRARDRPFRIAAAGALGGLAFLTTQKAVYFDVALGLALAGDAALARRYAQGLARGAWLVLGAAIPVAFYCLAFGGAHPLPIAENLLFGPLGVASPHTAAEYGGLRHFVVQTLVRNALLYVFCFAGIGLALSRVGRLESARRVALIFSLVVTALVFAHNQPWPYVFVMALPFMALWAIEPFDAIAAKPLYRAAAWAILGIAIAASFARNIAYLDVDNVAQLRLVDRAESLIGPDETYFDGVGMLPNRPEPSPLWLDRHYILKTLREGEKSDAYAVFARTPPKIILWSYRMDSIYPVVGPLIENSYVKVAPNIWIAGRALVRGETAMFDVPIPGVYSLYSETGAPLSGLVDVDGRSLSGPFRIAGQGHRITLESGPRRAFLLPLGSYAGKVAHGPDNDQLFANVYS